jgi:chromate transporter
VIRELFFRFIKIGLCSIGGGYAVLPLIQEEIVKNCGWLTEIEFTDILTISQMTPGPLAVNASTFAGIRLGGPFGGAAATVGCILPGVVTALCLYLFFQRHGDSGPVRSVLAGLKAASAGLIAAAAGNILLLVLWGVMEWESVTWAVDLAGAAIFAAALYLARKHRVPMMPLLLLSGAAGLFLYA